MSKRKAFLGLTVLTAIGLIGWQVFRSQKPAEHMRSTASNHEGHEPPPEKKSAGNPGDKQASVPPAGAEKSSAASSAAAVNKASLRVTGNDLPRLGKITERSQLMLPLPGGGVATGVVQLVRTEAGGLIRVGGLLTGDHRGSFSLVDDSGQVSGRVLMPQEKVAYVISSAGVGSATVQALPLGSVICYPFPLEPRPAAPVEGGSPGPQAAPPILSSRPAATAVLYLDFDGETVTDPDWPAYASDGVTITGPTIVAPASTLSNAQITEVWNRVKEDYWPFDIDVTTDLNRYNNAPVGRRMRVIITPNDAAAPGAGGVAYVGSFTLAGSPYFYFQSDHVGWVFNSSVDGIAEAISHELGHTLGLEHDGRNPPLAGSSSTDGSYYYGHGNANSAVGWAPIMGAGYYQKLVQWSKGEYPAADNQQDDVAIISGQASFTFGGPAYTNTVGYIADDAGNTRGTALSVDVSSGSADFAGMISSASDSDFYAFTVSTTTAMTFNAAPPNTYPKQADLDIQLELQDSSGTVLSSSNPDSALDASINFGAAPGTYYLKVSGAGRSGNGVTDFGYSNYGSIGQYSVSVASAMPTPPVITGQDAGLAGPGDYATLNVYATGTPVLSYQWQRLPSGSGSWVDLGDDQIFSGAHTSRLLVLTLAGMNGDQFRCLVSNVAGQVTSNPVPFSVNPNAKALAWVSINFPGGAATGSLVTVTATVVNAGATTWGSGDRLALLGPGSNEITSASLSGVAPGQSTTVTLTFTAPYEIITTGYSLQPLDTAGQFLFTSRGFAFGTFGAAVAPSIVTQPAGYAANVGDNITFSVLAIGQTPFTYQWRLNGADIPGATNATLVLNNVQVGAAGTYTVRVSNTLGFVISDPAVLTVGVPPGVTTVMAAGDYTLFLRNNGSRWALGYGFDGQLGDGTINGRSQPAQIDTGVASLAGGPDQSAFVKLDGTLWAAGRYAGRLTGSSTDQQVSPVPVINGTNVAAVEMGFGNTYFIRSDGTLWAAGGNNSGQVGDGTTTMRNVPVQIATSVASIAAGNLHTLFLRADGSVWGIGTGTYGGLSSAVPADINSTPRLVMSGAVAIAAGVNYSAVLKADGTLWFFGQIQGVMTASTPTQIASGVSSMEAGNAHLLFIKTDGSLWAVGQNFRGQLGDGTTVDRATPVPVTTGVVEVAAGATHSLFIKNDGSLWAMGSSLYYQIGNQVGTGSSTPVQLATGAMTVPVAPGNVSAGDGSTAGAVRVSWSPSAGASSYEVWRNTANAPGGAVKVGEVRRRTLHYDNTAIVGTTYYYWVKAVNSGGSSGFSSVDSGYSKAPVSPVIGLSPANYIFLTTDSMLPSFTVAVIADPDPSFRWQIRAPSEQAWTDINPGNSTFAGALGPTLTFLSIFSAYDGYQFRCVVTNSAGTAISDPAVLSYVSSSTSPRITAQPQGRIVNPGDSVTFTVSAASVTSLSYQWRKGGAAIPGATASSYTIGSVLGDDAGSYDVVVTNGAGSVTSAAAVLTVNKLAQAITFAAPADRAYTPLPFGLVATSDSGLPVTFSIVSGPATTNGGDLTLTGVGTVTVRAAQGGNATYASATNVDRSFVVSKAVATVTLGDLAATYDGTAKGATATTSPAGLNVVLTYDGGATAPTNAGSYTVAGTVSEANYEGSTTDTLVIAKAAQTITFAGPASQNYSPAPIALSATADSGLPVTFSIVSGPATVSGSNLTLTGTGIVTVRASQAGDSNRLAAPNVDRSFNSNKLSQTITFAALADRAYTTTPQALAATASSGLPVSFSLVSGPATLNGSDLTITGVGTVTVRADQAGNSFYHAATNVDRGFVVSKAVATVTLGDLDATYDGTAKSVTAVTSPAGLVVDFTYDGGAPSPTNAGSYTVVGTVNEANYQGTANGTLVIAKADQTITFTGPANQPFSTTPITLSATASSGLAVTFTVVSGPATVAGDSLTLTGSGAVTVRATQGGDANRNAAPAIDQTFTVTANFASWRLAKFTAGELLDTNISGPNADPDHDGFANLLEYALDLEPKSASTAGLPQVGIEGSDWAYTYTRPADRADVAYVVEMSVNLTNWSTVTHQLVSTSGGSETWRARYPLASAANCYFRLKVTQ